MVESHICTILLVAAAGIIGRLWPRKVVEPESLPAPVAALQEYGLLIPPGTEEITFKNLNYLSTYVHDDYRTVVLKAEDKIEISFRPKYSYNFSCSAIPGVVKK